MALKNPTTGEYLKITNFHYDEQYKNWNVGYLIFANIEQRTRWETGLSEYERTGNGLYNGALLQTAYNKIADSSLTILNNIKKEGYEALKEDMFSAWEDA